MAREISPIAAQKGTPVKAKADRRCSCKYPKGMISRIDNPTCPVHGHGRPAGTGR